MLRTWLGDQTYKSHLMFPVGHTSCWLMERAADVLDDTKFAGISHTMKGILFYSLQCPITHQKIGVEVGDLFNGYIIHHQYVLCPLQ